MKKTKNVSVWIKPFLLVAILIGVASLIGTSSYYIYSWKINKTTKSDGESLDSSIYKDKRHFSQYKKENFIPNLEPRFFEKFVKTDQKNNKFMDETVIQEIVKDVVRRLRKNDGKLYFDYKLLSQKHAIIDFLYIAKNKTSMDEKSFEILID
ncbi:MHO_1590 family protein [Mycoplasma sp. Sp48II]|uniref:MHO_1590 family protein n=1 Tax=unclassified Mycoplasma TaxID=2683645 RepID=UPI003A87A9E9